MSGLIEPHGGKLVDLVVDDSEKQALLEQCRSLPRIRLSERTQCDLEMLAIGAFSPLEGFANEEQFYSICENMCLPGGLPWSIPITLSVDFKQAERLEQGSQVCLTDEKDRELAVLTIESKYKHDKDLEAEKVYLTRDRQHPGVKVLYEQGDTCLGGPVRVIQPSYDGQFKEHRLPPKRTRQQFAERGWRCDGLLIHPLVGQTKTGDIPAEVRMKCYQVLIEGYYAPQRVMLTVMPSAMRYAGPREAVLHAIIRKNYGCTHFIVGRDHAGVGNYYGTYDAQKIFDRIDPQLLGISPLKFEHAAYCKLCDGMVSSKTCGHDKSNHVFLSGTKVREMLSRGELPPPEFTRPEVAKILLEASKEAQA